ncbi:Uncharacterized protein ALO71_02615 [Pseudomonas amygdali pv. dendropanacis]|uniref:Uncharacterized protein n=1 Tax=Pseudomonas amygdali pv. dendropanacis TaxID=235272 RepID=A0A0P9PPL1_PSEA0|nr:DUF6386 family protein [Pseudomonas amygdali]KPX20282.1 Uncharacterized protein ALO71_02615 [Pseudomonas amygdali pv. dendropanacis]KWS83937.1 hypothetical protein AL051_20255 [Pseudomonas amygdali pv. dendropanacis]
MLKEFSIFTSTATISIFDIDAIKHRVSDSPDWWSIVEDEILEINKGNIAFLGLGDDGGYTIKVSKTIEGEAGALNLHFPSGNVFIGAGEDTSGGDLEPDGSDAIEGETLSFAPGNYSMKFARSGNVIELCFEPTPDKYNFIKEPVRI